MPTRLLKESICTSATTDKLTWFEEVLFYRLIVLCDDYGLFDGRIAIIKARAFPLKALTDKAVMIAIESLMSAGLIEAYEVDGGVYLKMTSWEKHQNIRAKRPKYPLPNALCRHLNTSEYICIQMNTSVYKCSRNPIQSNPIQSVSESKSESESKSICPGADAPVSAFEALWKLYPKERREGKQHAFKAYKAARKAGVTDETIRAGIEAYIRQIAARHTQAQYVKTAGTWFYGNCWNDDYSEKPIAAGKQVGAQQYEQRTYTKEELEAINDPAMQALLESARKYTEGQHDD